MPLVTWGMLLIVLGVIVVFAGMLKSSLSQEKTEGGSDAKFSFVGFVGPFPFGFGNDRQWVMASLAVAMVLFALMSFWLRR